ncbi:RNA-binding protein [Desertibacillus haloalkaliphilus]|uniref:YlmH family RNA-binding protein n=1 Tax=Desertibacillus haloalkaliphilus TaxID=1328930 RepID=UPI001C252113|nr:RNA-binding protein [Desertibacillus haloalkaliphilus]MBU8907093.1 RNA-binding protein [Desertibacillus haloalkaliphilus]
MSIYQHFREEERAFVDQVLQWKDDVSSRFIDRVTDFLDPREQDIVRSVIGHDEDVRLSFWGGTRFSERKRAYLSPPYLESTEDVFALCLFQVDYPKKFVTLEHRDVLGALMGLGIKREKFGDILMKDNLIQVVVAAEIADFVEMNVESIGKAKARLQRIEANEQLSIEEEWDEEVTTLSSLRLDVVLAEMYHLSRTKVTPFIQKKLVKVNWRTVEQPSFQLDEGDYLSVRGLGRSKLLSIEGKTKKGKWRVSVGKRK